MRIGLDGIVLRKPVAGSHRYFEELLTGLAQPTAGNEFVVFSNLRSFRADALPRQDNFSYRNVNTRRWIPAALEQQLFPAWGAFGPLDVLHSTVSVPPLWYHRPTVATVSDLAFELFPETTKWTGRWWRKILTKPGIARASRLITLSESTKRDLKNLFGVPSDKIRVVYPYTPPRFRPMPDVDAVAARYHLPSKYILYVGTLERRKNLTALVRAFAEARRMASLEHALVLVGQRGWLYEDVFRTVEELGLRDRVLFLGYVPDEDLPALYTHADLFVYLSLYEGFGLPPLEAMACGAPVIVSNVSSLPEVVGDAGLLVNPRDVPAIASEFVRVLADCDLRAAMRDRGLARARLFSQERFIQQTLEVYRDAARV